MDQILLARLMDIGEKMLVAGAEVNRVEDTLSRMAKAYDVSRVDVFTITSSIVVTVIANDGVPMTQTRRILAYQTDLDKLSGLNELARTIAQNKPDASYIEQEMNRLEQKAKYPAWTQFVIYGGIAAVFTLFFGGTAQDALASGLLGMVLKWLVRLFQGLENNAVIIHVVCPFLVGLLAVGMIRWGLGENLEWILIGNIMLLIPGVSLTNSIRDIISGDTMAGLLRMSEAILISLSIAIGFGLASLVLGGIIL